MKDEALVRKVANILISAPFPIDDPKQSAEELYAYAELIKHWNNNTNLVSEESVVEIINNHIIDSVYASFHLPEVNNILDIGTGAGFPGIPLAILRPKTRIILLDSREKPIFFLKEVRLRLKLGNLKMLLGRIEDQNPQTLEISPADSLAISRAYSPAEEFFKNCSWLLESGFPLYYLGSERSKILAPAVLNQTQPLQQHEIPYFADSKEKRLFSFSTSRSPF